MQYATKLSAAFGIVILSIAAAAVIWRGKPESIEIEGNRHVVEGKNKMFYQWFVDSSTASSINATN
jgi:hypothetical protein